MGFSVHGLDDLMNAFDDLAAMPDALIGGMLNAQGDVVVAEQKKTASAMLRGPYYKSLVAGAVTKGRMRKAGGGKVLHITFEGEAKRTSGSKPRRIAEIAFVNEFGKTNQPARPFIETANEQCADAATKAAADVLDGYLKEKGL